MKNLITIAALAIAAPASAQNPITVEDTRAFDRQYCSTMSELARNIALARHRNVPMREMMETADKSKDETARKLGHALISLAYERPRYSTEEFIQNDVRDFENEIFGMCLKARTGEDK